MAAFLIDLLQIDNKNMFSLPVSSESCVEKPYCFVIW